MGSPKRIVFPKPGEYKIRPYRTSEENMRVGLAADHGGFELKEKMLEELRGAGYDVVDLYESDSNVEAEALKGAVERIIAQHTQRVIVQKVAPVIEARKRK